MEPMKMKPGHLYLIYYRADGTCEMVTGAARLLTLEGAALDKVLSHTASPMFDSLLQEMADHDSGRKPKDRVRFIMEDGEHGTVDDQ